MKGSRSTFLLSFTIVIFVIVQSLYIQTVGTFTTKDLFYNIAALIVLAFLVVTLAGGPKK